MDVTLYVRVLEGESTALKELYDLYIDQALRVATAITRNREHAKDAVQETWIRVFRHFHSYKANQPFEPWLFRILTNECNRIMKRETKIFWFRKKLETEDVSYTVAETDSDLAYLHEAIQSLKDLYRIPIILKYLQGFSEKEIAEILELNVNTLKSRLLKGRQKLRDILEHESRKEDNYAR